MNQFSKDAIAVDKHGRPIVMVAKKAEAVSPSDTTELSAGSLYIGGAGDVVVILEDDDTPVTYTGVNAGTFMPISVRRVMAATSATDIVIQR